MKFSIIVFLVIFLYWHLGFSFRIWLGFLLGFVADSVSLFPFGTYTLIFISSALLVEILRGVFSNTDSLFTKGVAVGSVFLLVSSIIYPVSYLLGRLQKKSVLWNYGFAVDIIVWSLIPAMAVIILLGLIHFLNENKKS